MSFHVGQKVVCVDDVWTSLKRGQENRPHKNAIYCIREIYQEKFESEGWCMAFLLQEITNYPTEWLTLGFHEAGFRASRFRPLIERKTDISVFTKMLKPRELVRASD